MEMGHHQHQSIEMPLSGSGVVEQDSERPSGEHVKRPMNAFMVWAKTERRQLAMRLPGMPNSEVSKILGDMWRRLPDEQKDKYRGESEKIRRKHKQEHPDYRYHPKRQSRKQKALDSDSPLAASLIQTSKMQQQQQQQQHQQPRAMTPTMNHQRLGGVKDDSRPQSAPPDYQQQPSMISLAAGTGNNSSVQPVLPTISSHVNASAMSSWWSPSSTPPASTFTSAPVNNSTINPSPISAQFQTSLPASPSSQDLGGSLSASSSTGWLKQNSPADSTNSKHQRSSPCLMTQQPPRRHSQSPLVGAVATNTRMSTTSVPLTTMPTSGSLLPTGSFYDKSTTSYFAPEQPAVSTMAVRPATGDIQRYAGLTVSTPRVARPEQTSPSAYETSSPLVSESRDSVIAPGTVFYPAYQPTTYLQQPTTYQWLDNRTHFVLPDQLASTQHNQVYQQSVAS